MRRKEDWWVLGVLQQGKKYEKAILQLEVVLFW